tara:strand:- start:1501 stop:1896 length:396 start_codon:yes stop_codon:yes gene_type:complete
MTMMEYKHGKDIESLILEALIKSNGEQKEASLILDISESALCRWIQELDISNQVAKIRKNNNLPPTPRRVQTVMDGDGLADNYRLKSCDDCGVRFESLISVNVTGVTPRDGMNFAIVRDHLNVKHWFALNE